MIAELGRTLIAITKPLPNVGLHNLVIVQAVVAAKMVPASFREPLRLVSVEVLPARKARTGSSVSFHSPFKP